jgi:zinc transport system substrate-binding protein
MKWWIIAGLSFIIASCGQQEHSGNKKLLTVSILPEKYFIDQIACEEYTVHVMIPPGANHEAFDPTPKQILELENSVAYFKIGNFEFERILMDKIGSISQAIKIINLSEGIDLLTDRDSSQVSPGEQGADPHIWLSPKEVKRMVLTIYLALEAIDPQRTEMYKKNYERLIIKLDSADNKLQSIFEQCRLHRFIIYHPALGYLARDYGLEQIAIEREGKNPAPAYLRQIIDFAKQEHIRIILIQKEFDTDNALAVAREINGTLIIIDPMAYDWFSNMEAIANTLNKALNP